MMTVRVLFVCLGNICRSPTAEGVFRKIVEDARMQDQIIIDSAGTGDWHIGKPADARSASAAKLRGYDLSLLRGRQVSAVDFDEFDFILAMDNANLKELEILVPAHFHGHLGLFLEFSQQDRYHEVPDPYYGGDAGFETVLDLIEDAARGLLQHIQQRHRAN